MNDFKITQDLQIRRIKQESVFPIRATDWRRLRNLIENFSMERKVIHDLFSATIGIFITSIFTLISFYCVHSIPNWAIITIWTTLISSSIIGLILLFQVKQQKKVNLSTKQNIIDEIDRVEELFDSGSW